jgi:hypothetical protein
MFSVLLILTFPLVMTAFELFAASTWTGVIASGTCESLFQSQNFHYFRSRVTSTYQSCQNLHRKIDMMEESFPALTEIVQVRLVLIKPKMGKES